MNSEPAELEQSVLAWLEKLSEVQRVAVAPVLGALGGLMTTYATAHSAQEEATRQATLSASEASETYAALEDRLGAALEMTDPQGVRDNILSCLELMRSEKVDLSALLHQRQMRPESKMGAAGALHSARASTGDATTGLPGRLIFERTVSDAIVEGKESMVALFIVERLAYINKRFGRVTGDEILLFVAQYLAQELPDSNSLCRWSGPAFAVLVNSNSAARKTEMQIRAISRKQLSKTIDSGGRSVMLPISCSCMVEVVGPQSEPEVVFSKLDDFLSAHVID